MTKKSGMPVRELCLNFLTYLRDSRAQETGCITALNNGFEDWLKFEFCIMCAKRMQWEPGLDFGVEYTARLITGLRRSDSKRIDVWTIGRNEKWHYIELKDVFNNQHTEKQVSSWIDDFEILHNSLSDKECPDDKASLIFGVGFENSEWSDLIENSVPPSLTKYLQFFDNVSDLNCAGLISNPQKNDGS